LTEPSPDLIAENLACRRGERMIFTGVSFRLPVGGALVLMGANGSGKTSLLRILATLLPAAAGSLLWGSASIEADLIGYRARLRYVGHHDAVKPGMTPRETLVFSAALQGLSWRLAPRLADAALAALALARLLTAPALIWLLDEPTTALDHESRQRFETAIAAHRANGGRVAVASHQAIDIADATTITLDAFTPSPGFAVC